MPIYFWIVFVVILARYMVKLVKDHDKDVKRIENFRVFDPQAHREPRKVLNLP